MALVAPALSVSARDCRIITAARAKLAGARVDFDQALNALREATEEDIPGGRIYYLGDGVIGSLISGVGIIERTSGIVLVRHGEALGRFA
ncbi:hypothetical protein BH11MYX3_BH11MYX3_19530 [soil metagenome]